MSVPAYRGAPPRVPAAPMGRCRLPECSVVVVDQAISPKAAESIAAWAKQYMAPGFVFEVRDTQRGCQPLGTCLWSYLELEVKAPGASATFSLEQPGRERMFCPFGSRGWGYGLTHALFRLNEQHKQGKLGEHLISGDSGATSMGGVLVERAMANRKPRYDRY